MICINEHFGAPPPHPLSIEALAGLKGIADVLNNPDSQLHADADTFPSTLEGICAFCGEEIVVGDYIATSGPFLCCYECNDPTP